MPLRQMIPAPYHFEVYPIEENPAPNSLGNKTLKNDDTPVVRDIQSIHVYNSDEKIDPAYIDRVVTQIRMMVPSPREWHSGDIVVIPNMGRYKVYIDPALQDMGPLVQYNYLFGGKIFAKRVN